MQTLRSPPRFPRREYFLLHRIISFRHSNSWLGLGRFFFLRALLSLHQLAAELRIPVRNTYAYVFVEHGNDLGSSNDVQGNPTTVYMKMGQGSSYGVGAKFGLMRVEYAVSHNSSTGAVFFRFGERF